MAPRRLRKARRSKGRTHIGKEDGINFVSTIIVDVGSGNIKGALTFTKMARTPVAPTVLPRARLGQGRTPIGGERYIINVITYRNGAKGGEGMLMKMVDTMGKVIIIGETMNLTQRSLALTSPEPLRRRRRACIPVAQRGRRKPDSYKDIARIGGRPNTCITVIVIMPIHEETPEPGPQRPIRRRINLWATLELSRPAHQRREFRPLTMGPDR